VIGAPGRGPLLFDPARSPAELFSDVTWEAATAGVVQAALRQTAIAPPHGVSTAG